MLDGFQHLPGLAFKTAMQRNAGQRKCLSPQEVFSLAVEVEHPKASRRRTIGKDEYEKKMKECQKMRLLPFIRSNELCFGLFLSFCQFAKSTLEWKAQDVKHAYLRVFICVN